MEEHTIDLSRREGAAFASRGADPGAGPPAAELVWTRDGRTKPGPGAGGDLVPVSEDPLTAVARGAGKVMENLGHYSKVLIKSRRY